MAPDQKSGHRRPHPGTIVNEDMNYEADLLPSVEIELTPAPSGFLTTKADDEEAQEEQPSQPRCGGTATTTDVGPSSAKSIGWLGSIAIAVNALAGPAVLQLPATYQESGFIPTTITLLVVGILSSFCSLHMANVVSQVPENANFQKAVEFSEPFRVFWGHRAFVLTQTVFFLCTVCLNVAAIVDTAQVVDSFLGHTLGSVAVRFHPLPLQTVVWRHGACTRDEVKADLCDPFGQTDDDDSNNYGNLLLSAGYVIAAAVFLPVCLMDLKENVTWQIFGFAVLCLNSLQFILSFCAYGLDTSNVPKYGDNWDRMLGVILFNFSLVVAIPSWLHEKKDHVRVDRVVYGSSVMATVLYIAVGTFGALAIPNVNANMLEPMVSGAFGDSMQIGASFFAFIIIGLDIPLFSVLTRYNLVNSGLCGPNLANLLVVYIPWFTSWLFYQGDAIAELLEWGGVLFTSLIAFLLPLALALYTTIKCCTGDNQSDGGSIRVYGNLLTSRRSHIWALSCLLLIFAVAVLYAIGGMA